MKKKQMAKGQKRRAKIGLFLCIGFFMFFSSIDLSRGNDWTPLPWGLNLEELNKAFKETHKNGQIREDKDRSEFELQYTTTKSITVRKGKITALLSSTDLSTPSRLYGYSFEGKFFGQAIFFKDHPEFFPETVARTLKEKYPQGKILRSFGTTRSSSYFEYKSDQLYVFSAERGVFYYDPNVLEKIVKIELERINQEEVKIEKEVRDKNP